MDLKNNKLHQEMMDNINQAFSSLLQDRDLSEITVSDICKAANINSSTFFEEYADISALADAYAKEIEKQISEQPHTQGEFAWLFEYVKANADIFNLYFKLGISKSENEYKTIFFKNGVHSVLKMWFEGGCVESAEEIGLTIQLWNYRNNAQQFKSILERKFQTDSAKEAKKLQAEYEKKQSRFEEIDKILCKLYEDSALGKIPESRYEAMSAQYESEHREIKEAFPDLRQRIEQLKAESDATDKFVNLIKKYTIIDRLDAAILNELIDKIVVHHKEVAEDGRVFQQVEIYYRFIGKLEHAAESEKAA